VGGGDERLHRRGGGLVGPVVHVRDGPGLAGAGGVVHLLLDVVAFQVRQEDSVERVPVPVGGRARGSGDRGGRVGRRGDGQLLVGVVVAVDGQGDLLEVVGRRDAGGGAPHLLD